MSVRSEKISGAIGELDETIINEADKKRTVPKGGISKQKRSGVKMIVKIVSAAACIAVIGGLIMSNITGGGFTDISIPAEALAEAVYPEAAQYPNEQEFIKPNGEWDDEGFDKVYEPWSEQSRERCEAGKRVGGGLDGFYKTSAEEFLSDGTQENRAYSPVNVYMALAMLAETAGGNSRSQILGLLGSDGIDGLRAQAKNMWLANYRNDGATTSILANSVWLDDGAEFKRDAVSALAENYLASVYRGDTASEEMTSALRDWLDKQTGGLLGDAVKNVELDPDTVMSLCSTVYFRAKWGLEFRAENNDTRTFHAPNGDAPTEFMNATNDYGRYYAGEDFGAMSLSFADGGRMWFILPDEDKTVDDVLAAGEYLGLTKSDKIKSKTLVIHYSVPKFDISSEIGLADGLKELGVTDVFDSEKSDFSPITDAGGLFVSEAKHAVRVQIDEEGCTAAAFTQILVDGTALPPEEEMNFILDRPFIFVIESDTNQPLFIGTVYEPGNN